MTFLHLFLCIILFLSGTFVAFSRNPISSVLYLIFAFCNAAIILFLFNVEFLGLIFIIIYVGAIAVLFLFVIMMLNIKAPEIVYSSKIYNYLSNNIITFLILSYLLCFGIGLGLSSFFKEIFYQKDFIFNNVNDIYILLDNLNNIDILGQVLYNYYLECFLIAGLVLLVALIGAIVLTLNFSSLQKGQTIYRQLSRTDNFLSFFK